MNKTTRSTLLAAALAAAAIPLLQGCFPVAAVGVGAGALIATDRRNAETYLADEAIEIRAMNRIGEKFGERVHVNVTGYNMKLLLTGEAPDAALKAEIEQVAGGVPNVKAVANELQVAGISGYGARSNDTYITSKVKARFIEAGKFSVNHVKVVTEAGVVYLLGLVTRREADAAAETARTTAGVLKVVRMFEYIGEDEARRLDARAPQDAKPPRQ
ncbi:MAG: BON domain-containing protein [Rhodocyclales bacterium]|nr:BON domain-containing protein [Rhodocyclales bacterium]